MGLEPRKCDSSWDLPPFVKSSTCLNVFILLSCTITIISNVSIFLISCLSLYVCVCVPIYDVSVVGKREGEKKVMGPT